jgi:hypothetical protein
MPFASSPARKSKARKRSHQSAHFEFHQKGRHLVRGETAAMDDLIDG